MMTPAQSTAVGYARVSTYEQNLDLQLDALEKAVQDNAPPKERAVMPPVKPSGNFV
jgi:predicted site-specific integrase-resolvase